MEISIKRRKIIEAYFSDSSDSTLDTIIKLIIRRHQHKHKHTKTVENSMLALFKNQFKKYWWQASRNKDYFRKKRQNWLDGDLKLEKEDDRAKYKGNNDACQDRNRAQLTGRPLRPFSEVSDRSKRRRTEEIRSNFSAEELAFGSQMNFRKDGKLDASEVCQQILSTPTRSSKINAQIKTPHHNRFTPAQALAMMANTNLSKQNYIYIRKCHKNNNCNVYPSYTKLLKEKEKCYPDEIHVDEFKALIPLQSLVDHTTKRLLVPLQPAIHIIENRVNGKNAAFELLWKCGFDGSGCHSVYNIRYDDHEYRDVDEENIFSVFICPLRLSLADSHTLLWNNPAPSSPLYCRPLRLTFKKETSALIRTEWEIVKREIENIVSTHLCSHEVEHKVIVTMVDGKICQTITNTPSAATCYMCSPPTNPSNMNDLTAIRSKGTHREALSYGISPLHLLINTMECVLHIGYRLQIKTWAVKGNENKRIMAEEKKRIQREIKQQLGLNVDRPSQGAGNSNCGNTARRFFEAPDTISHITGVNRELISRLGVLLTALNCGFDINSEKYKTYAMSTAELYISEYPWYYMPLSVHKMLLHGADVIQELCVPVGHSSEEGMEGKHKELRNVREHHTCKTSRIRINKDLIHWLLVTSDPVVSSNRPVQQNKRKPFHPEVLQLLREPDISDSDSESDDNVEGY